MFDIPTALTARETDVLSRLAAGREVYEAGALLGYSTCVLAKTAKHVTSVDPHFGYPTNNPSPTWGIFNRNIQRFGLASRVTGIRKMFQHHLPRHETLAWADLTGCGWLISEFLRATRHIPLVAIHDYARTGCGDSTAAIDLYIRRTQPLAVSVFDTLVVIQNRVAA